MMDRRIPPTIPGKFGDHGQRIHRLEQRIAPRAALGRGAPDVDGWSITWSASGIIISTFRSGLIPILSDRTLNRLVAKVTSADTASDFEVTPYRNSVALDALVIGTATSAEGNYAARFPGPTDFEIRVTDIGDGTAENLTVTAVFS